MPLCSSIKYLRRKQLASVLFNLGTNRLLDYNFIHCINQPSSHLLEENAFKLLVLNLSVYLLIYTRGKSFPNANRDVYRPLATVFSCIVAFIVAFIVAWPPLDHVNFSTDANTADSHHKSSVLAYSSILCLIVNSNGILLC